MEVDTKDLQRLESDLAKKADALKAAIPDLFVAAVIEARQELKPVWTSAIGILPTTPFPTARILARKGASKLVTVRPKVPSSSPQRRRAGAAGQTKRTTSGNVGGRERISADEAAAVVVAAIKKKLPEMFETVIVHGS